MKKLLKILLVLVLLPHVSLAQTTGQFVPFLRWTNATGTSATTTSFFATTASSTSLFSTSSNLGVVTSGLINSQTISSAANFTGSLTATGKVRSTSSSSTGGLQVSPTGANAIIEALTDDSNHQPFLSLRSTGTTATQHIIGMDSNAGGALISGGTQRALILETTGPYDIILGYNSAVHTIFSTSGGVTFTGALSGITTLNASGLGTFGNLLANASSTFQNLTFVNATSTSATTTNLYTSGQTILAATSGNVGIGTTTPRATLHIYGSMATREVQSGAGNVDISAATTTYNIIGVNNTASARTITLPLCNSTTEGIQYTIKDESGAAGTNNITIQRKASDTIDGATSYVVATNYQSVDVYCSLTSGSWFLK